MFSNKRGREKPKQTPGRVRQLLVDERLKSRKVLHLWFGLWFSRKSSGCYKEEGFECRGQSDQVWTHSFSENVVNCFWHYKVVSACRTTQPLPWRAGTRTQGWSKAAFPEPGLCGLNVLMEPSPEHSVQMVLLGHSKDLVFLPLSGVRQDLFSFFKTKLLSHVLSWGTCWSSQQQITLLSTDAILLAICTRPLPACFLSFLDFFFKSLLM